MSDPKALYLDLMTRIVTNTVYRDPNQSPSGKKIFHPNLRAEGRDWPMVAHTMVGEKRLENVRQLCERAIVEGIPGDFIETGVWRGGSCILMRAVLAAYAEQDRLVWCCDSFEGLPKPDAERYPADAGDKHHIFAELAIPLEEVRENFDRYGLLDDRTQFVKGLFRDTLHKLAAERFAVIRLDGDMYESTIQALEALYPKLSAGGFAIIDDYGAVPACKTAVEDFRNREGITAPLQTIDWTGVWWQK